MDGALIGVGSNDFIAQVVGNGNGGPDDTTGFQAFQADLGVLTAGTHTLTFGGFNNKKTATNEETEILIDNVVVTAAGGEITNEPPTDFALSASSVNENAATGTAIGTFGSVADADVGDTHSFSLLNDAGGRFEIVGSELRVLDGSALDFENASSHLVSVRVTDDGVPALSFDKDFTINLVDVNDPPTDFILSSNVIAENSANGTVVGTFGGVVDQDTADTHGFTLETDAGGRFELVGNELRVLDGSLLDFETATSHQVTVRVTDDGVPAEFFDKNVTINVSNVSEGGEPVALIDASFDTGADGFIYVDDAFRGTAQPGFADGTHTDIGAPQDGVLRVLLGGVDGSTVNGMSGGWQQSFALAAPTQVTVSFDYNLTIASGYEGDERGEALFSLDGALIGNGSDDFLAELVGNGNGGPDDTTGFQTFQTDLGVLSAGTHTLTFGGFNNKKTFPDEETEILIDNVLVSAAGEFSNEPPTDFSLSSNSVDENAANGTVIGTLGSVVDADAGDTHSFSLLNDAGGRFEIVGSELRVLDGSELDFESASSHLVNVRVTDDGVPALSFDKDFTITLVDTNDPPTDFTLSSNFIAENSANGTVVGTFGGVVDQDGADSHSFSLETDAGGRFQLVGDELRVLDGSLLDFESATSHQVTVRVTDDGVPAAFLDKSFTINVSNVSEGGEPVALIDTSFDAGSDGFVYVDDAFRGTAQPGFADGTHTDIGAPQDGVLQVLLGGINGSTINGMSGGWQQSFSLAAPTQVTVSFDYNLTIASGYESDERGEALFSVDGALIGSGSDDFLAELVGNGNGGPDDTTGFQTFQADLGVLSAGTHTLSLGGFNNKKTASNEETEILFDNVLVTVGEFTNQAPTDFSLSASSVIENAVNGTAVGTFGNVIDPNPGDTHSFSLVADAGGRFEIVGDELRVLDGTQLDFETQPSHLVTVRATDLGGLDVDKDFTITLVDVPEGGGDPTTLIDAGFDTDAEGFLYGDDLFRGTNQPGFADGSHTDIGGAQGGVLSVLLGGINGDDILGMSGGWQQSFSLSVPSQITVSFDYNLTQASEYESDERSEALFSLDGTLIGASPNDFVDEIVGNGNGGPDETTGFQTFQADLGVLSAGTHTLTFGGFNNKKTFGDETTEVLIDNVLVTADSGGGPGAVAGNADVATDPGYSSVDQGSVVGVEIDQNGLIG